MDNIQKFRSIVSTERSEKIYRDLIEKQDRGEINTEEQLRRELETRIADVDARGKIIFEIPVRPGEIVSSTKMADFFKMAKTDIDVMFVDVDNTDHILTDQADVIRAQIQSMKFAIGQLKAEAVQKRIRIKPGAGFTTILRDSFDRGYTSLAGRAEVPYDLFKDVRSADDTAQAEAVPIQADARVEGIGKKLILPAAVSTEIGFKSASVVEADSTGTDLVIDNIYPLENAIDGRPDTFWSRTIGLENPVLGSATSSSISMLQGSGTSPTINLSGLLDTRPHDYYIKVVNWSGIYPVITSLPTPEGYIGPVCRYDTGARCNWGYDTLYSENCINALCSRYETDDRVPVSGAVALEDGYGYDTGAEVVWTNFSGVVNGTAYKVSIEPSGTVGATLGLELILKTPSNINWIQIDPVIDSPFILSNVEYTRPNESGRIAISTEEIDVRDQVRIDTPVVEAEKVYLTFRQGTYRKSKLISNPKAIALNEIEKIKQGPTDPTPDDTAAINLQILMEEYVRNPDVREIFVQNDWTPEELDGYFYQFGLFEANCGLDSYSENAVAVSKERRVRTPTMFGIQANLESGIQLQSSGTNFGTLEFSVVKLNYDTQGSLINIQDFPVPDINSEEITERIFLDADSAGELRFAADSITSIKDLSTNRTLASTEYVLTTSSEVVPRSTISITREDIGQASVLIVVYRPQYSVFLDSDKTLILQDNRNSELSISNIQGIITATPEIASRKINFSDVYTRIILRRNDHDSFTTPRLRDYQLLINEQDPNRFFV